MADDTEQTENNENSNDKGARGSVSAPIAPVVRATDAEPSRLQGFTQSTTYVYYDDDIFSSSFGRAIGGYTFLASSVTADANGDKIVREGTLLAVDSGSGKAIPRTSSGVAVMVNHRGFNCRDGDVEIPVVKGGRLNARKLRDGASTGSGTYGAVLSGTIIGQLSAVGIFLDNTDV